MITTATNYEGIVKSFSSFVNSYLVTAAWVTAEPGDCTDWTKEARLQAEKDCQQFINMVVDYYGEEKATSLLSIEGEDVKYLAAHDFLLTRDHHGAGFWDKENYYGEEEAKMLTEIAGKFKSSDCMHVAGKRSRLCFG